MAGCGSRIINLVLLFLYLSLKLKVMARKITIRKGWREVTLREWMKIGEVERDPELAGRFLAKRIKIAAILSDMTEEELMVLPQPELMPVLKAVEFVEKHPPKRKKKVFTLEKGGTEYMFHPQPKELNGGEMISVEQLMIDEKNTGENKFADVIAIMVRPAIKVRNEEFNRDEYEIEPFDTKNLEERRDYFLDNLTADKVFHEVAFFFGIAQKYSKLSLLSTQEQQKKEKTQPKSSK